ncbi:DUF3892 domain-containing protein [Pseudomonas putida]|uniref:DUF3892 domain-containing protein n=1 Tax=Pseudomonas putida TaxID=303 RepID=UPI002364A6C2|nr:DUF3892 domain-containing protein [Pseudomonas putida]MDD2067823.1 DUF3892 domain-containing protein [Pseudomonas putida]
MSLSLENLSEVFVVPNFNYYVSAVEYNSDDSHIAKLRVHEVGSDGKFKPSVIMTRPQVVELIKKNKTFSTMTKVGGEWKGGAALQVIPVTTDYLKTKKDSTTRDNLENLPSI